MKAVGLITMHRVCNCGSRLQTLASVRTIEKLGYSCTVIDYLYPTVYHTLRAAGTAYVQGGLLRRVLTWLGLRRQARTIKLFLRQKRDGKRISAYLKSFRHTEPVRRGDTARIPHFDVYLTGSDQTWNARFLAEDYTYLLDFVPDNVRKVSYAASFGGDTVDPAFREAYARLLARYDAISVREASGVDIVRSLTGKTATCVLDPTLLLTADEWRPMATVPPAAVGRYVFCYVLAYFKPGPWLVEAIAHVARSLDAKVIFFSDAYYIREARTAGFTVLTRMPSHSEFLGYVDRAAFVVTTSFHGTAFAVNFHKDFITAINPKTASDSRAGSFLKNVGLEERGVLESDDLQRIYGNLSVDYSRAHGRLEELRNHSMTYLKDALEGTHG